jgi:MOSC domain-containing protein YiiM
MSLVRSVRRSAVPLLAALLVAAPALAGCGSSEPEESASDLLARAKKTLDDASSVHFQLSSEGAPSTGSGVLGGEGQAVYCYAQEDAEWWQRELGRDLPAGRFGENLRTEGIDLNEVVLGERWRVGTALFEVTAPRIPCATFERFWAVPQLVKRFTARGATGAYLRVLETGDVGAGDAIEVVFRPDHGITTGRAFRLLTTEQSQLPELEPALRFLPIKDQARVGATIEAKIATRTAAPSSAGEPTAAF